MSIILRIGFLLLAIALASFAIGYRWLDVQMHTPMPFKEPFKIELKRGQNIQHVASQLESLGALTQTRPFVFYARYMDVAHKIKAGEYNFDSVTTPHDLLMTLVDGDVVQHSLTLVEGLTAKDYLRYLKEIETLVVTDGDKALLDDPDKLMAHLNKPGVHPEGQFFPDTYFYTKGESAIEILQRSHKRLHEVLTEEWEQRMKDLPYETPYEALIMASIIEKETGVESERAEIAGVFVRRLRKGMRLQTDPTVIYGLGDKYQGNIKRVHLKQKTDYNTYVIFGLPPTPIANVGREAIHAALHPADGKTLYFVAKGDGSHVFSETLEAHNRAVREYQLKRRSDYRSAPKAE
ncbi:MAG: endolytic transglycosylase MltG [Pseudomonadales bacterium]|nr:endolytic transglycosylase MltG [Pseudomonadales bacterium]